MNGCARAGQGALDSGFMLRMPQNDTLYLLFAGPPSLKLRRDSLRLVSISRFKILFAHQAGLPSRSQLPRAKARKTIKGEGWWS